MWTGDTVLMVLSAAGVASLLKANEFAFSIVKFVGAGYLGWLAFTMLRAAVRMWVTRRSVADLAEEATPDQVGRERPYRRALVISLLNPKAILFFVAFFVQFVDPTYAHPAVSFLVLGAFAQAASVVYLSALIVGGSQLAATFRRRRGLSAAATSAVGAVFLAFAVKLSVSQA